MFCCCIYFVVKVIGVCIVLYNMNNLMYNVCVNMIFCVFFCEGYVYFLDVNIDFMKDRECKYFFVYKSVVFCVIFFFVLF